MQLVINWKKRSVGKYADTWRTSSANKRNGIICWLLHIPVAFVLTLPQLMYILSGNVQKSGSSGSIIALCGNIGVVVSFNFIIDALMVRPAAQLMVRVHQAGMAPCAVRSNQLNVESQFLLLVPFNVSFSKLSNEVCVQFFSKVLYPVLLQFLLDVRQSNSSMCLM